MDSPNPMLAAISVLGSIASILGAIWAYSEAKKSRSAAKAAESVREELIERRKLVEVSTIHAETKRILQVISKVGPASDPRQLTGVNCEDIAKKVERYLRFISEQSGHFNHLFENRAIDLCNDLKSDVEALSEAATEDDMKSHGKVIYYKIQDFLPATKKLADVKRESGS